ncbi:hypothetical protein BH09PSE1_BH09PSE1_23160 [soil metagenome]
MCTLAVSTTVTTSGFTLAMGKLLDRLRENSSAYVMEETSAGYILVGVPEAAEEFNVLVRDLLDRAGEEFVVLPTTDGKTGYERVVLVPL